MFLAWVAAHDDPPDPRHSTIDKEPKTSDSDSKPNLSMTKPICKLNKALPTFKVLRRYSTTILDIDQIICYHEKSRSSTSS